MSPLFARRFSSLFHLASFVSSSNSWPIRWRCADVDRRLSYWRWGVPVAHSLKKSVHRIIRIDGGNSWWNLSYDFFSLDIIYNILNITDKEILFWDKNECGYILAYDVQNRKCFSHSVRNWNNINILVAVPTLGSDILFFKVDWLSN